MPPEADPAKTTAPAAPAAPAAAAPAAAAPAAAAPATPPAAPAPAAAVIPPAAAAAPAAPAAPAAATPPAADPAKPADPAAPAAPAAGEPAPLSLKLPENAAIDQATVDQIAAFATEHKLSQEQATALLNQQNAAVSAQRAAFEKLTRETYVEAAKADKEIGGEHFAANLQHAKAIFDKFGTPELRQWLDETGLGNNPEVVRFVLRIHKATAPEGAPVSPTHAADTKADDALRQMFPSAFEKKA